MGVMRDARIFIGPGNGNRGRRRGQEGAQLIFVPQSVSDCHLKIAKLLIKLHKLHKYCVFSCALCPGDTL